MMNQLWKLLDQVIIVLELLQLINLSKFFLFLFWKKKTNKKEMFLFTVFHKLSQARQIEELFRVFHRYLLF